jgi:hypothetical protein
MAQWHRFSSLNFSSDGPIYPNSCLLSSASRRVNRAMVIQHFRFDSNRNGKNIFITGREAAPIAMHPDNFLVSVCGALCM